MLGVRYAFIEYEVDSVSGGTHESQGNDVDGDYFGITFGFSF